MKKSQTHITPPSWALNFFRWFCNPEYTEDIEGDLLERFEKRKEKGQSAKWLFIKEIFLLLRPGIIKSFEGSTGLNNYGILKNYMLTAYRSARKEKTFSILNIICLTIGLGACLYVGMYTVQELSYDKFHEKADRIYRINQTFIWGKIDELFGSTGPGVMKAIQSEVPEFETMTRVLTYEDVLVSIPSKNQSTVFEEGKLRSVDSTFFDVFTFPLIKGNPKTALVNPHSAVLTETIALKYFGTVDVLGEQLVITGEENEPQSYLVTGVATDVPHNSHVTFDILTSMSSVDRLKWGGDTWWWTTFVTFGVVRDDADISAVEKKVAQVPAKHLEGFLQRYRNMSYEEFIASGETWDLYIQPLLDIHLRSTNVFSRLNETGDIKSVYILNLIAGLILLLSIINFINLTTARASRRSKEVGVRKVLGTQRKSLVFQFVIESVLFCLVALIVSGILLRMLLPILNDVSGKSIDPSGFANPGIILGSLLIIILIGIVAGLYPALYLTAIKPTQAFKGDFIKGSGNNILRRSLVALQFAVSIALIASALIINKQVQHWLAMDLGFERNNIVILQRADRLGESKNSFMNELATIPSIELASLSHDTPPYVMGSHDDFFLVGEKENQAEISYWTADENFLDVYGVEVIAGKNFLPGSNNENYVMVSRSTLSAFGLSNPSDIIGRSLSSQGVALEIIGVFEDINTEIRWRQLPIAIYYNDAFRTPTGNKEISVKFKAGMSRLEINQLLVTIQEKWESFHKGLPMNYFFLDQQFESIFNPTIKFGKLMNFYAMLASIIAGLGLTGLVAYVIERKNKEIGIRKILGASVSSVLVLLTSEFGKLLLVGFFIATGVSWYLMNQWIKDFEYQTVIEPLTFILAGLAMLLMVILTLSYQTLKAARANPVKYLRDE